MGRRTPKIPPNLSPTQLAQLLTKELESVWDRLRAFEESPTFKGPINMQGNRISNVGMGKGSHDVITQRQAIDEGMHRNAKGQHVAGSVVIATSGIRSKRRARERHDLVPLEQVQEMVGASGNAVVTTNTDQNIDGHKLFKAIGTQRNGLTLANGVNNNVSFENPSISGSFLYISGPTSGFSISGFRRHLSGAGGLNGQIIIVFNATNVAMTLLHMTNGTGSDDANRMRLANNSNIIVGANGSVMLIYADLPGKWVNVARI